MKGPGKNIIFFLVLLLLCLANCLEGQIAYPGKPFYASDKQSVRVEYLTLTSAEALESSAREEVSGDLKIDVFAGVVKVSIHPESAGSWSDIDGEYRVWRMGFTSAGASSMAVSFDPFVLAPGAKVFLCTSDGRQTAGAYTFRNNKGSGILATSALKGDSIVVELQVDASCQDYGKLGIGSVSAGFPEKSVNDEYYGWSEECEVDINCIEEQQVQQQKYAVCRLIIESQQNRSRCTGTLLNNTSGNGKPYILTAAHCVKDLYSALHTIAFFDYESPWCNGPDGELKSISGANLVSRGEYVDFALIELTDKPPVEYYPLYSGWNAGTDDLDFSYCIHHPEGDVKKFCVDSGAASTGTFPPYAANTFWEIDRYEMGTTENGSSGAALFNSDNQVVGSLTGGGAACSEYIFDYYQKFRYSWDFHPESEKQLREWLDPQNTGMLEIGNLDPYQGIAVELSNLKSAVNTELLTCGGGWGYISGHNSLGSEQFAEHFYRNGTKYIAGVNLKVGRLFSGSFDARLSLTIWDGVDEPGEILFRKDVFLFELDEGTDNYIRLDTLIYVDQHFFVGYEIYYESGADTFALYTGELDTSLSVIPALMDRGDGWEYLNDGDQTYTISLALSPMVLDYYPPAYVEFGKYPYNEVTVYPNPAYDKLQVLLKRKPEGEVTIRIYDGYGHLVWAKSLHSPESNFSIPISNLQVSGIYFLNIKYDGHTSYTKFLHLK